LVPQYNRSDAVTDTFYTDLTGGSVVNNVESFASRMLAR